MKTGIVIVLSVEIPDGYHSGLTNEPIEGGGYRYTGHLYRRSGSGPEQVSFDLADITADCQRAINTRIQDAITGALAV